MDWFLLREKLFKSNNSHLNGGQRKLVKRVTQGWTQSYRKQRKGWFHPLWVQTIPYRNKSALSSKSVLKFLPAESSNSFFSPRFTTWLLSKCSLVLYRLASLSWKCDSRFMIRQTDLLTMAVIVSLSTFLLRTPAWMIIAMYWVVETCLEKYM